MKKNYLLQSYATRKKFDLFAEYKNYLPDPDKILADNGYDYSILRDLLNDAHLIATVQQRKMQVLQMGWEVEYDGDERIKESAIRILRKLPLSEIMNNILDAVLFGFAVGEVEWAVRSVGSKQLAVSSKTIGANEMYPVNIIYKPQEWFIFNRDNVLMMRKRIHGTYVFEEGEELPDYKFILTQYQPSYTNPYGEKVLSRCYWPITFKRAGIEFWQLMMERFGMPYLIGRYGSGATPAEKDQLLEDLKQMVKDSISVFEEGKEIEIKESPQYDFGQLYSSLVNFHNKEISKAVLTVTLTTEIEKVGSYKASEIHKEMLNYLGITDKKLVEKALNKLLEYYTILNYGISNGPRVKLNKKETIVEPTAERDKILCEMGIRFTKEYFRKRYNLSEGDFTIMEDD